MCLPIYLRARNGNVLYHSPDNMHSTYLYSLYQVMQLLLTPSHQIKTPSLLKFVVKVNSVNLGYERVAVLAKEKSMVCLFLKHHVPVQWILFEHKHFIPLSESELPVMSTESSVEELSHYECF